MHLFSHFVGYGTWAGFSKFCYPIKSLQSLNVHWSYVACSEYNVIKDDMSTLGLINNAAFFIFHTVSVM